MSNLADPVAELAAVGDPALRARLATAVAQFLAAITREVYLVRNAAVVEHRPSGSVTEVAAEVGMSRTRVQQLAGPTGPTHECAAAPTPPQVSGSPVSTRGHETVGAADLDHTVSATSTAGEPS